MKDCFLTYERSDEEMSYETCSCSSWETYERGETPYERGETPFGESEI
jgi:hypothetical protein